MPLSKVRLEMRPQGSANWLFNEVATINGPLVAEGTGDYSCPQFRAVSASSYIFTQTGVWEIRVTTDPYNDLCETNENNNQLLRTFVAER
jgi:subtilase family serine protease